MNITFENSVAGRLLSSVSDAASMLGDMRQSKAEVVNLNRSTVIYWRMGDTVQFAVSTCKMLDEPSAEVGEMWAYEQLRNGNYSTMAREDFEDLFDL